MQWLDASATAFCVAVMCCTGTVRLRALCCALKCTSVQVMEGPAPPEKFDALRAKGVYIPQTSQPHKLGGRYGQAAEWIEQLCNGMVRPHSQRARNPLHVANKQASQR